MKKLIKKYGQSLILSFSTDEQKIYNIGAGDVLTFEIVDIKRKGGRDKEKWEK